MCHAGEEYFLLNRHCILFVAHICSLVLQEHSDQGLHCLPFLWNAVITVW